MPTCCGAGRYWLAEKESRIQRERERERKRERLSSTDMNGCGPQSQILSLTRIRHAGVHVTFTFVARVVSRREKSRVNSSDRLEITVEQLIERWYVWSNSKKGKRWKIASKIIKSIRQSLVNLVKPKINPPLTIWLNRILVLIYSLVKQIWREKKKKKENFASNWGKQFSLRTRS